jgi:catechol 2,3-dioxygenase-like lactoylglutathione lyase family enzyme
MGVAAMNHFTVLSDDLEATRRFYCDLFGFKVGTAALPVPGWWLYADGDADFARDPSRSAAPGARRVDHMAFSARDLPGTVATLKREGINKRAAPPARRHLAAVLQ